MTSEQEAFDRIDRYIKGEASANEIKFIESLFLEGESNQYLRESLEKDWYSIINSSSSAGTDLNHIRDILHKSMGIRKSLALTNQMQRFIRIYTKIAAIFLLPILMAGGLIYGLLINRQQAVYAQEIPTMIYAPMGSRVSFILPDGTKGVLNGGSTLSYALPFKEKRHVRLNGEIWLEVKHDVKHPFIINADSSTVKVVGTSLNVNTFSDGNYLEVVLKEGQVRFTGRKGDREIAMLPSERIVYRNGQIQRTIVDPSKFYGWIDGKLIFRSDPMIEVARRIERWYNVKIIIASKDLEKFTFRATFQDDKLEDVLKFLAMTSPITYKISPRTILPNGTVEKEQITLYSKY